MTNETDLRHQFTLASGISFATSLLLFGASWVTDQKIVRLGMLGGSIAATGLAVYANNRREWLDAEDLDIRDILSNARKQNTLLKSHDFRLVGSEVTNEEDEETPDYRIFDESRFSDDSVHMAIFASSGSGKSVFLRYLFGTHFKGEQYLLIDPHGEMGLTVQSKEHALQLLEDFAYGKIQKLIIGYGRDFDSIAHMYMALEEHLGWRFQNGGESANWPTLNIIVEELPAIYKGTNDIEKDLVPSTNQSLLTEARKVGLRLIAITQGDQVSLLGLKGMSSLRSAYRFVRLGMEAVKYSHQKKLFNLEDELKKDIKKSLEIHKRSGSQNMFKGSAVMIDEDEYLPFKDLSKWTIPMDSDLYDEAPVMASEAVEIESVQVSPGIQEGPTIATQPESTRSFEPSTDFPSYARKYGIPQQSNPDPMAATIVPVEKKVTVEITDYYVSVYQNLPIFGDREKVRPGWIKDWQLAKYIKMRNEGDTPSKAAKNLFSGKKYFTAKDWLESVYVLIIGSLEG